MPDVVGTLAVPTQAAGDASKKAASTEFVGGALAGRVMGTDVTALWAGTQAQYDAIATKSATTLYFIKA